MNEPLTPVPPVLPVAPWLGGKRNLARRICAILDATPCAQICADSGGEGNFRGWVQGRFCGG